MLVDGLSCNAKVLGGYFAYVARMLFDLCYNEVSNLLPTCSYSAHLETKPQSLSTLFLIFVNLTFHIVNHKELIVNVFLRTNGMNRLSRESQKPVIAALVESNSIRATVRMTGVSKNAIQRLLAVLGPACG